MVVDTRQAYDSLLLLYISIAVVSSAIIYAWVAYALVRYRDRGDGAGEEPAPGGGDREPAGGPDAPAPPSGVAKRPVAILTVTVAVILLSLTLNGINAFSVISEPPDVPDAVTVHATGFQFGWSFSYANGNTTNGVMYVPAGRVIEVQVTSTDVFHSFGLPDYRVKADAIPDQTNELWFLAGQPGEHPIYCMELCGTGHNAMHGVLKVLPEAEWDAWVASYSP